MENEIELRTITQLLGLNFLIPEYQRGYRWTEDNVRQLLNDIWEYRSKGESRTFYCLQPIVVKAAAWQAADGNEVKGYELIDGQQRLTTIHRIITYLMKSHLAVSSIGEDYGNERFNIYYKTRLESKEFLETDSYDDSVPDLYYLSEAYATIRNWFENPERGFTRGNRNQFLDTLLAPIQNQEWSVKVIWYEVNDDNPSSSEELFVRLNRGKIPLTSAELIKAKLVSSKSFSRSPQDEQIRRKTEIVQIWEEMEAGLHDPNFWAFITNRSQSDYSNRIELLFDMVTGRREDDPDPIFSFIHFFLNIESEQGIWEKWIEVERIYRSFRFWFSDKNFYHKIGYLIAVGISPISIIQLKESLNKKAFEGELDKLIGKEIPDDWSSLTYREDRDKIRKLLLLHNVEIIRKNKSESEFFPFSSFKQNADSIEHIHAQNTEDFDPNKKQQWVDWLKEHSNLLSEQIESEEVRALLSEVEASYEKLNFQLFLTLSSRILSCLNDSDDVSGRELMHRIDNLALLGARQNTSLSNSVFELKRRKIINMDKSGIFLPVATKRVFLKYYSDMNDPKPTLWTKKDRDNYLNDIATHLKEYKIETVINP